VLGAASASTIGKRKSVAHYHLIELETAENHLRLTVRHAHYDLAAGSFSLSGSQAL
jgi:hypothetical protein